MPASAKISTVIRIEDGRAAKVTKVGPRIGSYGEAPTRIIAASEGPIARYDQSLNWPKLSMGWLHGQLEVVLNDSLMTWR